MDAQVTGLVTGLFADTTVQDAVQVQVAALVSGCWVGAVGCGGRCKVGAAVAGLMADSAVSAAVVGLMDTPLVGDFFRAPGWFRRSPRRPASWRWRW